MVFVLLNNFFSSPSVKTYDPSSSSSAPVQIPKTKVLPWDLQSRAHAPPYEVEVYRLPPLRFSVFFRLEGENITVIRVGTPFHLGSTELVENF